MQPNLYLKRLLIQQVKKQASWLHDVVPIDVEMLLKFQTKTCYFKTYCSPKKKYFIACSFHCILKGLLM